MLDAMDRKRNSTMAPIQSFWDYDREADLTCPVCGWSGPGQQGEELQREVIDVRCPTCDALLLIVNLPTIEQTRAAAEAGNPRAIAELPYVETLEARAERAAALQLTEPGQLPALPGQRLRIIWDFETRDGESWTILRHGRKVLWRELAYYEGYERLAQVFAILHQRYGDRLAEVRPTARSETYLYGDYFPSVAMVRDLNQRLQSRVG
jgi:hypothetical protein